MPAVTGKRPLMAEPHALSMLQLLALTVALAGVEFVWATQMIFTVPIFQSLGLPDHILGVSWMAGPISGMLVQTVAGHFSDLSESRFGRRRPFLLLGLLFTLVSMGMFANARSIASFVSYGDPSSAAIAIAFVSSFGDDLAKNAIMGPLRALASDVCPKAQLPTANALFAAMVGLGQFCGYTAAQYDLREVAPLIFGRMEDRYQALIALAGAVITVCVLITAVAIREPQKLRSGTETPAEPAAGAGWVELGQSPVMQRLCCAVALGWAALFPFMIYVSSWMARDVFTPEREDLAVSCAAWGMALFALTTSIVPQLLCCYSPVIELAVGQFLYIVAIVGLLWIGQHAGESAAGTLQVLIALCGGAFGTLLSAPFRLIGKIAGKEHGGKYVGALNVAVVAPQLMVAAFSGSLLQYFGGSFVPILAATGVVSLLALTFICGPLAWSLDSGNPDRAENLHSPALVATNESCDLASSEASVVAVWLLWFGTLPFVTFSCGIWCVQQSRQVLSQLMLLYAAIILTFIAGMQQAVVLGDVRPLAPSTGSRLVVGSVSLALLGFSAVASAQLRSGWPAVEMTMLSAAFMGQLLLEMLNQRSRRLSRRSLQMMLYEQRYYPMIIASLCLAVAAWMDPKP